MITTKTHSRKTNKSILVAIILAVVFCLCVAIGAYGTTWADSGTSDDSSDGASSSTGASALDFYSKI